MAKWMMKGSITAVLGSEDALNAQMWSRLVNSWRRLWALRRQTSAQTG